MKRLLVLNAAIVTSMLIGACNRQTGEDVKITATSVHESYGPEGLLKVVEPGWHAKPSTVYPQIVTFAFAQGQQIRQIGFLPQAGGVSRSPKKLVLEISDDGNTWKEVAAMENDCNAPAENWRDHSIDSTVITKNVRIRILSNCGAPDLLTLRGVRFK